MVQFLDPETTEILPFLDPEIVKIDKKILDPETVEIVWFLDPEIVEKVDKFFMIEPGSSGMAGGRTVTLIITSKYYLVFQRKYVSFWFIYKCTFLLNRRPIGEE